MYNLERERFVKKMEEIIIERAPLRKIVRRLYYLQALDNFHEKMGVEFELEPQWSLWTALYFAGTLFTTIGRFK